jgi:hypothetical protein
MNMIIVVYVLKESRDLWKLLNVLVLKDSMTKITLNFTANNVLDYVKLVLTLKLVTHVKLNLTDN